MYAQDISLIIKPLPAIFRWMGLGPVNLAAFLQARVSAQWSPPGEIIHLLAGRYCIQMNAKAWR
jgi:hypothetical protein